jgi:tRNA uridine 5-carbamoylmethylation protein Kti12
MNTKEKLNNLIIKPSVLLICGPPGIGKSTFCLGLNKYIWSAYDEYGTIFIRSFLISYDDLIDNNLEKCIIAENEWKLYRRFIIKLVELLISYLKTENISGLLNKSFNEFSEKQNIINEFKLKSPSIAESIKSKFETNIRTNLVNLSSHIVNNSNHYEQIRIIIILDDIFYYESMRYSFYKQSIKLKSSYMSYCFKPNDIKLLVERNKTRIPEKQINEFVLEKISNNFEYPNDIGWEKQFSYVSSGQDIGFKESIQIVISKFEKFDSFLVDLSKISKREKEQVQLNKTSVDNLIHKSDLILRKLISQELKKIEKPCQVLARELSKKKTLILDELKSNNTLEILHRLDQIHANVNDIDSFDHLLQSEMKLRLFEMCSFDD